MPAESRSQTGSTVAAVERAFAVLQALSAAGKSMGVSEIARETDLAKSTVSRLLTTLEGLDMVGRAGDAGRYRLGSGLAPFTPGVRASLIDLARPHLIDLVDDIGEDAGLAVVDGFDVLYIHQVGTPEPVQVRNWTGSRHPPHTVAAGFVLMRSWPESKLTEYLSGPLGSPTAVTDTDPDRLAGRVAGWSDYVWTHREFAEEVNGAAAPVFDIDGRIVAAVNLYGPAHRFPGSRSEDRIGARLAVAGDRISRHLATTYV